MNDTYTVYIHVNKINDKAYVGLTKQSCQERWRSQGQGYKNQPKFWRAIEKYGWDNFDHKIVASNLTADEAGLLEQLLIQTYDSYNNGYNADLGGTITNHSPETIEKIRQSMYGHTHTQATKDQIHEHKRDTFRGVYCVELNKSYECITDAAKETGIDRSSIAKCCKGIMYKAGEYTWRYTDENLKQQYASQTDNRINKAQKPVRCITTGKIYDTVKEAALDTGSDASNIIKVCKGKYKTTNNLKWEYYNGEAVDD